MVFFQCALSIHHAGHISFLSCLAETSAKAPYAPRCLAWRAFLVALDWDREEQCPHLCQPGKARAWTDVRYRWSC